MGVLTYVLNFHRNFDGNHLLRRSVGQQLRLRLLLAKIRRASRLDDYHFQMHEVRSTSLFLYI